MCVKNLEAPCPFFHPVILNVSERRTLSKSNSAEFSKLLLLFIRLFVIVFTQRHIAIGYHAQHITQQNEQHTTY